MEFLGYVLSAEGLRTSPDSVAVLQSWSAPLTTAKQVRQFLGLAMWYRCFIPHLATIAAPALSHDVVKSQASEVDDGSHRSASHHPTVGIGSPMFGRDGTRAATPE